MIYIEQLVLGQIFTILYKIVVILVYMAELCHLEMLESVVCVCSEPLRPPAPLVWWWVTIVLREISLRGFSLQS